MDQWWLTLGLMACDALIRVVIPHARIYLLLQIIFYKTSLLRDYTYNLYK